jgi:DNA sulfur modification protein DndC
LPHLKDLLCEIIAVYKADSRPWVIGYSGGKDSTAVLRLVYEALASLDSSQRTKQVFVVSSDTLVETPVVVNLITETLASVQASAVGHLLPFSVAQVTPKGDETFWVNLIGRGYPAPTRQFRWCTERMKIDPVSAFIREKVAAYGEVVVLLGSRISESASRAQVMKKHKIEGKRLARHTTLPNAYVYTPIETWSTDDVWEYLFSGPAPWGGDHQALFDLYKDSNAGECPLVIDKTTPSCGNSRFGCWVCTVVTKDKAMDGLIESGHRWLVPLQEFRNQLFETTLPENKHRYRHDRRRDGKVTVVFDANGQEKRVFGPYRMEVRREFLRKLLQTQNAIHQANPDAAFELITGAELEAIRVHWRTDPNEPDWEDSVPRIYEEVMGRSLPWQGADDAFFGADEVQVLRELESKHGIDKELPMKLIELELSLEGLSRRRDLFTRMETILKQDWDDTAEVAERRGSRNKQSRDRDEEEKKLLERYETLARLQSDAF